jgi:DNA repair photolyase
MVETPVIVKEIHAKGILSKSRVLEYTINPYVGCEHACTYCYARFMKRFTGHREAWGSFVDVKINAADLLQRAVKKKRVGRVWISGVCDPYQPVEAEYELTRHCLEILLARRWPITVQTKSPLVERDLDLLREFSDVEVGLTITTADEQVRKIFEPHSPSIDDRIKTLDTLRSSGLMTFAMIAPLLPNAERLVSQLRGKVDNVLIDRMNYHHADWIYRNHGLAYANTNRFFAQKKAEMADALRREGIPHQFLF